MNRVNVFVIPVAYPELISRGVSKSRKCKWLVKVGASNGVTPLINKKSWPGGGGVSGQPENPPGYATGCINEGYGLIQIFTEKIRISPTKLWRV